MKSKACVCAIRSTFGLLTISVLVACDAGGLFGTKSPWPVIESRLAYGTRFEGDPIYWLDNDRVLIPGYERHADVPVGKEAPGTFTSLGLYVWDTKKNTYDRLSGLRSRYVLCYNDGYIVYTPLEEGEDEEAAYRVREGPLGHEEEKLLSPSSTPIDYDRGQPAYSPCPRIDPAKRLRPDHVGRHVPAWFLKEEDGYLSTGNPLEPGSGITPKTQDDPVKLYSSSQAEPIALPLLAKELDAGSKLRFSPYIERYVITPSNWKERDLRSSLGDWPRARPMPVYLLAPDGKADAVEVPYGTWLPPHMAWPTRQGLFIASSNAPTANSKQAGGWLSKDGRMIKLFDHLVSAAGVSPDGCKIAYANNDFKPETTEYVRIINLCE